MKLLKLIKWLILLAVVAVTWGLAIPFLILANWLSPHEAEEFARKQGLYLHYKIREDLRR